MVSEVEGFPSKWMNKLLQTPGKNVNSSKQNLIHQLNRTRKNTILSQYDIDKAFDVLEIWIKTKEFDLSKYQNKIVFGSPEESRKAKHELRVIAIVLRDILNGNMVKKYKNQPFVKSLLKSNLKYLLSQFTPSYALSIAGNVILFAGAGGIAGASILGAAGVAAGSAYAIDRYRRYKLTLSIKDLLIVILKILDEGKTQHLFEQMFTMTNRNTGTTFTAKGPYEMEVNPMFFSPAETPSPPKRNNRKTRKSRQTRRK